MSEFSDDEIMARMAYKLYRRGNWGESHTSFENLKKGFNQRNLGKKGFKRVDKIGEKMIKDGLLHSKSTGYGLEVSLEYTRKSELISLIRKIFPDEYDE
ncbi:MAG: hypothetical protein KGH85_08535 [Thaumarchaeota archaeon]|nr:hypothetical protein [Candidatus Nitrosotalea sp.]MDE1812891.1 hypothetical protein [Nitrososphaerota archaeon]